ncbi:MAG: helix-turn-helix domain-containing protein [Lachnospiraceae bacterium]|nr:helix-turn-helix domain-containing protein [Lachnospiraceae bacterium]
MCYKHLPTTRIAGGLLFRTSPFLRLEKLRCTQQTKAHKKIEAAKSLLLSTDDPIHEVGSMVGIDNTNHFIHLFKKHTGVTPFVYRQNAPQSIRETHCPSAPGGLPPR